MKYIATFHQIESKFKKNYLLIKTDELILT